MPVLQYRTVHGPSCQNSDLNRVSRSPDSVVNTSSQISDVAAIALQCSIFRRKPTLPRSSLRNTLCERDCYHRRVRSKMSQLPRFALGLCRNRRCACVFLANDARRPVRDASRLPRLRYRTIADNVVYPLAVRRTTRDDASRRH